MGNSKGPGLGGVAHPNCAPAGATIHRVSHAVFLAATNAAFGGVLSLTGSYEHPSFCTCQYLGIQGWVDVIGQDCPILQLMANVSA